jgi:hypothetical protein
MDTDWKTVAERLAKALENAACMGPGQTRAKDEALQGYYEFLASKAGDKKRRAGWGA